MFLNSGYAIFAGVEYQSNIISMRTLSLALLAAIAVATSITGCRSDRPEEARTADTAAVPAPTPTTPDESTYTDSDSVASLDTVPMDEPTAPGLPATNGSPGSGPAWKRTELVKGVQEFVTAIDSNNQEQFWGSLSKRSIRWIDDGKLAPRAEIWSAARQTLGDIENRRITVIGGTRDSVALKIEGLRMIDNVREDDPVIIHLLREEGAWKVMYPGLLYPKGHLRR
jgi:hypothetical protein